MVCCFFLLAPGALAATLELPLHIPLDAIGEALGPQLVFREGPCRHVRVEKPRVEVVDDTLRLTGPGSGSLGVELAGSCQSAAVWRGTVQLTLQPWLDQAGRLRMRILDSRLSDARHRGAALIWDLSKRRVHPRLERFGYDIGALRANLISIVRSVAPPEQSVELESALTQLRIGQPRVAATGVVVPIALEVPPSIR